MYLQVLNKYEIWSTISYLWRIFLPTSTLYLSLPVMKYKHEIQFIFWNKLVVLCFILVVYVISVPGAFIWYTFPYPSGLIQRHQDHHDIVLMIVTSCVFITWSNIKQNICPMSLVFKIPTISLNAPWLSVYTLPSDAYDLTINGSDNGLSPDRRQAIIWTNAIILLIRTLGTKFIQILSEMNTFYPRKFIWKCRLRKSGNFVSVSRYWVCQGSSIFPEHLNKRP